MKILEQRILPNGKSNIAAGEFNGGEHLFLEIEAGQWQTVSCKLPNGKFITFAFVRSGDGEIEMECCDIHSTVGQQWEDKETVGSRHWEQVAVGFSKGSNTFDTRKSKVKTSLLTVLLHSRYHAAKEVQS